MKKKVATVSSHENRDPLHLKLQYVGVRGESNSQNRLLSAWSKFEPRASREELKYPTNESSRRGGQVDNDIVDKNGACVPQENSTTLSTFSPVMD